jgi:hypothetical protein
MGNAERLAIKAMSGVSHRLLHLAHAQRACSAGMEDAVRALQNASGTKRLMTTRIGLTGASLSDASGTVARDGVQSLGQRLLDVTLTSGGVYRG